MSNNILQMVFQQWLVEEELERQARVVKAREYHEGDQPTYLTDRIRTMLNLDTEEAFSLNVSRGVVEAVVERLMVTGFLSSDAKLAEWAWDFWQKDRVDGKQMEVHEAIIRDGEAFVVLDWDPITQTLSLLPHSRYTDPQVGGDGDGCKATYRNDDPNQSLLYISKRWVQTSPTGEAQQRMTVFYPDRIEKFEISGGGIWTPITAATMQEEGDTAWPIPWTRADGSPRGIPIIHFTNPALRPEATDGWPIQNALNKAFVDALAAGDVTAFRIFVARGFIPTMDGLPPAADQSNWLVLEPGQIIGTTKPAGEAAFDAIDGAPIDPLLSMVETWAMWNAVVTRTPISRYKFVRQVESEGTQKQQNEVLLSKVSHRQTTFGDAWEEVFSRARIILNDLGGGWEGTQLDEETELQIQWKDSEVRNRLEELQGFQIERDLGIPQEILWAKMGYTPEEIVQMKKINDSAMLERQKLLMADTVPDLTEGRELQGTQNSGDQEGKGKGEEEEDVNA